MKKIFGAIFLFLVLPVNCLAGEQVGLIKDIRVASITNAGPSHVMLVGGLTSGWRDPPRPSCASIGWWAFDTDTTTGKNILATLLAANMAGKTVQIWGTGICNLRGDMETILQVGVSD